MASIKEPFEAVYEKHFSEIYNYVYSQLLHREKTEDVVSDVFIKAMLHYDSYDPTRTSPRTWLTRIARNTLSMISSGRRRRKRFTELCLILRRRRGIFWL